MKFRNLFIQLLGIFTTLMSIILIYLVLFKDGKLREITAAMLIEFTVIIMIAISTKFFWYTSTESSIRTSSEYLQKREAVSKAIEDNIDNAKNFDDFIEIENDNNYNKYLAKYCKNMTVSNYKMSILDCIHWLFARKEKRYYMIRYMLKIERKANKQHKLSGANIRSLTQNSDGLTDDRNNANIKKINFLWTGAVFSFVSMFLTAAITFNTKTSIDMHHAILKMIMYVFQILFSILQTILKARITVSTEDIAYFNKILSILEKYDAYRNNPYTVDRVSYIPSEVNDGINNRNTSEEIDVCVN